LLRRVASAQPFRVQHVVLVLCLNVGVRPPDALQSDDVASYEAWLRPTLLAKPPDEASELVAAALQAQIEAGVGRGANRLRFKALVDPTADAILRHCQSLRASAAASTTRPASTVLLLFNGHGVPAASDNGEVWCFNDDFSQYMPLSLYSLQEVLRAPAVYVFDCPRAGRLLRHYALFCDERERAETAAASASASAANDADSDAPSLSQLLRDRSVLLAACSADQVLPSNPALPADFFTACLTTPLKTLLFVSPHVASTRVLMNGQFARPSLLPAHCDVPGDLNDKATPLGFLDWLLTTVCDAIAYEAVPLRRFQQLFREDITLAGLFRNFLVAQRLMGRYNVNPTSYPPLPDLSSHPLWNAFDAALEQVSLTMAPPSTAAAGAIALVHTVPPSLPFAAPAFFEEQLCAAELALASTPPRPVALTTLPIVLQALLGAAHRGRALNWLARFFVADPAEATAHCLAIDALPYAAGLLRTRRANLRRALLIVWAHLIRCDTRCAVDLCVAPHGVAFMLDAFSAAALPAEAATAAFVLAMVTRRRDQQVVAPRLAIDAVPLMQAPATPALRLWSALLVGELACARFEVPPPVHRALLERLHGDECADVRAAAAYALSGVLTTAPLDEAMSLVVAMSGVASDASQLVRAEVLHALVRFIANLQGGVLAAESVHECLLAVFELLERDPFVQIAQDAAAARRLLQARERSSSTPPPTSTFFEFALEHACGSGDDGGGGEWAGAVAEPLLALLADDSGDLLAQDGDAGAAPAVPRPGASSREPFGDAEQYWCSVRQLSTRRVDLRAPAHLAQLHNATPDALFRVRKRTALEQYVGEWQRREARGERYVHESVYKAIKKSHANKLAASTDNVSAAAADDDEAPSSLTSLRHPPVRLEHDLNSISLGKGVQPRCLLLDSIRDECVFAASDGTVGVWHVSTSAPTSRFRVAPSDARRQVATSLALLNRRSAQPLLLAAASIDNDACVRVWRDYRENEQQQLSAAWMINLGDRVAPSTAPPFSGAAAHARQLAARVSSPALVRQHGSSAAAAIDAPLLTAWRQRTARLVVSGRRRVLLFDAHSERDVWHMDVPGACVRTALHADYLGQRLIVGDSDGVTTMIDTRVRSDEAIVACLDPSGRAHQSSSIRRSQSVVASMPTLWRHASDSAVTRDDAAPAPVVDAGDRARILELAVPMLRPYSLVVVHSSGALRVWDVRAPATPPVVIGGPAMKDGGATTLCAAVHERLPLVAIGALKERLWLYSTDGCLMHEIRNHRFASARIGAVSHARFDQFKPHIVLGDVSGTLSLHSDDAAPFAGDSTT
jgi:hypothetical protein